MLNKFSVKLFVLLTLVVMTHADNASIGEESVLVSYAQDLYRQSGLNMPRSAFQLEKLKDGNRIFSIHVISKSSTLSDDMLQAFLMGGAVSQHARAPMNYVIVVVQVEFTQKREMILQASGECCENLYNNRMTVETFTQSCLRMK